MQIANAFIVILFEGWDAAYIIDGQRNLFNSPKLITGGFGDSQVRSEGMSVYLLRYYFWVQ